MPSRVFLLLSAVVSAFPVQGCLLSESEPVSAVLAPTLVGAAPRQVSIFNNLSLATSTADGELALYNSANQALLDRIQQWPVAGGRISAIVAQPVVLDSNYDGVADAVYVADTRGLVWFIALERAGFATPILIADFSALNYQFVQPLQLVQTRAASHDRQHRSTLILTASDNRQNSIIIALTHQRQSNSVATLSDLTDRSSLGADEERYGIDEQLWAQMQQRQGWYISLPRQVISKPQVYAGVVYLMSVTPGRLNSDCSLAADAEPRLHALHLHHAGLVYAWRDKAVQIHSTGELALGRDENNELQLEFRQGPAAQQLQTDMLAITAECADCTKPLMVQQFPQLIRLATFQTEDGAH